MVVSILIILSTILSQCIPAARYCSQGNVRTVRYVNTKAIYTDTVSTFNAGAGSHDQRHVIFRDGDGRSKMLSRVILRGRVTR